MHPSQVVLGDGPERIVKLLDSLRFDQYRHNRFASDCQALFSIETAKDCGCVSLGFSIGGASAM